MAMDSKVDTTRVNEIASAVMAVSGRIGNHKPYVSGHETRTRMLLIDPLLCALGWDVLDPDVVQIEAPNEAGSPDYVLKVCGKPRVVVEAKALGKLKVAATVAQVAAYIFQPSLRTAAVAVLTDGVSWRVHEKGKLTKATHIVKVTDGDNYKIALELYAQLARSNFTNIKTEGDWFPINGDLPKDRKLKAIRIDGGEEKQVDFWYELLVELAGHLIQTGALTRSKIPVVMPGGKKYLVNRSGTEHNGKSFLLPKEVDDGFWVNGHGGVGFIPWKCGKLIEAVGAGSLPVEVCFDKEG